MTAATSLARVGSLFFVLWVWPHGVASEAGPPPTQPSAMGGGQRFTPGLGPDPPAAVPGLMGFVESEGQRGQVHRVNARLLPDGSG